VLRVLLQPVLDGFGAVRLMRSRNVTTAIIAVTAAATLEVRNACLAAGMSRSRSAVLRLERASCSCCRYLTKPVEVENLMMEFARLEPFVTLLHKHVHQPTESEL